jgi:cytochrome c oxidase subunit II
MADSKDVLTGLIWVYTLYALAILSVVGWFAYKITSKGEGKLIRPLFFYVWVSFLVVTGVSLHIFTYNTIPWSPMDLNRNEIKADTVFHITVENHQFRLPAKKLTVRLNQKVLFDVTTNDLTYGFGLFRQDNTMVFQMQVVPGHKNDVLWQFGETGIFDIRSTEYSGPKGAFMHEKAVVEVIE